MRSKQVIFFSIILLVGIFWCVVSASHLLSFAKYQPLTLNAVNKPINNLSLAKVQIAGYPLQVELALTPEERGRGLSGKLKVNGDGMLFVFPQSSLVDFWNPEMKFPIELFWINNGQVIGSSYLPIDNGSRVTVEPPSVVNMVLEVPAEWSNNKNINFPASFSVDRQYKDGRHWEPLVR